MFLIAFSLLFQEFLKFCQLILKILRDLYQCYFIFISHISIYFFQCFNILSHISLIFCLILNLT